MRYDKKGLIDLGLKDLADSLEHVIITQGNGTGYDVKSFNEYGTVRLLRLKLQTSYYLYRVYDIKLNPLNGSYIILVIFLMSLIVTKEFVLKS